VQKSTRRAATGFGVIHRRMGGAIIDRWAAAFNCRLSASDRSAGSFVGKVMTAPKIAKKSMALSGRPLRQARPVTVSHYRCMTFAGSTKLAEECSLQAHVVERHEFSQVLSDVMALGVNIGSM
jgi:hypothetical protein